MQCPVTSGQIDHRFILIEGERTYESRRLQPDEGGDEIPDHGH
jgi:hypothetical protein